MVATACCSGSEEADETMRGSGSCFARSGHSVEPGLTFRACREGGRVGESGLSWLGKGSELRFELIRGGIGIILGALLLWANGLSIADSVPVEKAWKVVAYGANGFLELKVRGSVICVNSWYRDDTVWTGEGFAFSSVLVSAVFVEVRFAFAKKEFAMCRGASP